MTAFSLFLGAAFVAVFTWIISRLVNCWADQEAQAERDRRLRLVSPTPEPMADAYTGKPVRAAGLRSDVRRLG